MNILTLDTKSDERPWSTNTLKLMMQINFKSIGMGSLKFKAVNLLTQKCANRQKMQVWSEDFYHAQYFKALLNILALSVFLWKSTSPCTVVSASEPILTMSLMLEYFLHNFLSYTFRTKLLGSKCATKPVSEGASRGLKKLQRFF